MRTIATTCIKKASFWLIPILAIASFWAMPQAYGGSRLLTRAAQTEWVSPARKSVKAFTLPALSKIKKFLPEIVWPTVEYTKEDFQIRWNQYSEVFSVIKTHSCWIIRRQGLPTAETASIPC